MQDCLQQQSDAQVNALLSVLKQDLPRSTVVYHWILVQRRWSLDIPGLKVNILCPRGTDHSRGVTVAFTQGLALDNNVYGVVYAREGHHDELARILKSTRVVPWRHVLHFSGVLEQHVSAVREAATWHGIVIPAQQAPCHLAVFEDDTVEQFKAISIPEFVGPNVHVRQMGPDDLDQVWGLRPLYCPSYKPVIRACLKHNFSSGVFVRQEDGSEELASMVIQAPYGGMSMGASSAKYLKKGYHSLANAHYMCAMSHSQYQLSAHVGVENDIYLNFATKYGMKIVGKTQRVDLLSGDYNLKKGKL